MQGLVLNSLPQIDQMKIHLGRDKGANDELSGVTADSLPTGRVPSSSKDSSLCPSLMSEPQRPFTEEGLGSLCLRKGLVWWVPTGPGPLPCLASHSHLDRTMGGRRTLASIVGHCQAHTRGGTLPCRTNVLWQPRHKCIEAHPAASSRFPEEESSLLVVATLGSPAPLGGSSCS